MLKRLGIIGFSAAVLLIWVIIAGTFDILNLQKDPEGTPVNVGKTQIGGDFTLTDTEGAQFSSTSLRGKYMLVYFGFSSCPDICPTDLAKISRVLDSLGDKAAEVAPVFITMDPKRDTPQKLKDFSKNFSNRIVYLTGTDEQIDAVVSAFKGFREILPNEASPENYMVNHSSFIYIMGKDGEYITHFPTEDGEEKITAKLKELGL